MNSMKSRIIGFLAGLFGGSHAQRPINQPPRHEPFLPGLPSFSMRMSPSIAGNARAFGEAYMQTSAYRKKPRGGKKKK